jgi:hypothetical protein
MDGGGVLAGTGTGVMIGDLTCLGLYTKYRPKKLGRMLRMLTKMSTISGNDFFSPEINSMIEPFLAQQITN